MYKIICKHVPEALLKKEAAKNHFRQFGSVKRIVFRTASRIITVEYSSEDGVEKVLKYGNIFDNKTFTISKELSDTMMGKTESKKIKSKRDIPASLPDEVMAELDAMGGGPSLALAKKTFPRQEVVTTDQPKKSLKRRVPIEKDKSTPKKTKPLAFSRNNEHQELLEILNQRAMTIEDRFKALDARDKILRMLQKKFGTSNGFTRGTCPDMCPEKERLLRVIQHQVSYFEHNASKEMDPSLAVKQYSRSSADQESPLPHELRPVGVLQMTMSYLINNIMPLGETSNVNIGDWYHFLWDRTRSIRKDITQQELCCKNTVELLEQCARFHIHCSARLVAEDPSVFDQKINTENLTKCLQTLKYMYHDLRLKGEKCPNEAEFRAYIILLNLNDGNFMWEVQRLPVEIQESPQIKNAIQIYSVLNAYNFVKFFKLVRRSSYLDACILMRYFMQVRNRAIDVILRCYTPRITKVVYPLDTLTINLGFENVHQTIEFLQLCGLEINDIRSSVILDKASFIAPDLTYSAIERSVNLVESKRADSTLGQIVCQGILPNFQLQVPHSSFNEEGFLEKPFNADDFSEPLTEVDTLISDVTAEAISEKPTELPDVAEVQELSLPQDNEVSDLTPHQSVHLPQDETDDATRTKEETAPADFFTGKGTGSIAEDNLTAYPLLGRNNIFTTKSIFGNVLNQPNVNIFGGTTSSLEEKVSFIKHDELNPIIQEKTDENSAKITSGFDNLISATKPQFNKLIPQKGFEEVFFSKPLPTINQNVNLQSSIIPDNKPDEKSNSISTDEAMQSFKQAIREDEDRVKLDKLKTKILEQQKQLKQIMMREAKTSQMREIRSTVESLVLDMVDKISSAEISRKLEQLKSRILRRKMIRTVNKWRVFAVNKRRTRHIQEWTSGWINNMRSLPQQAEEFNILSKSTDLSRKYNTGFVRKGDFPIKHLEKNIDFIELTEILSERHKAFQSKNYSHHARDKIYWKCIISIPDSSEMPDTCHIINEKLQSYLNLKEDGSPLVIQKFSVKTPVRFCIEKQMGGGNEKNDADGLIFIAKSLNGHLFRRILEKFESTGIFSRVPIVLILQEQPKDLTNLKTLLNNGIISGYSLLSGCFQTKLLNLVERSLKFLAVNVNPPPPIEVNYLENVLFRNFLCSEIWKNASCHGINDPAYGKCLQHPNTVIRLYNDSLRRIKNFILDKSCYEYASFPSDFRELEEFPDCFPMDYRYLPDLCEDLEYQNFISTLFDTVMPLKTFSSWPPKNEMELRRIILDFACNSFEKRAMEVNQKLLTHLDEVLEKMEYNSGIEDIMWTDIMGILISEKYRCYDEFLKESKMKKSWLHNGRVVVVYHIDTLPRFLKSDWFYVTNPIIREILSYDEDLIPVSAAKQIDEPTSSEIEETISRVKCMLTHEKPDCYKCNIKELKAQIDDLSESLRVTKVLTRRFGDLA